MGRVCLVYDCLFPHTVGGAERWMRDLAERLAADGHQVTYLTLRQWDRGADPGVTGVQVRAVGPRFGLYTESGRRKIIPPLIFGLGVFIHLLRHGRRYDTVHTVSFPYFSLLAAGLARRRGGYGLVVDWFEVWTLDYWREYLGRAGGRVGWAVQRACARIDQLAFCSSELHARRLRAEGLSGEVLVHRGLYSGSTVPQLGAESQPTVVFVGRFIPEKHADAIVPAMVQVADVAPDLRAVLYGDGPERGRVQKLVHESGLNDVISLPGFVSSEEIEAGLASAMCLVSPSSREGWGMVVVEAASYGTPAVVVAAPDNAAVEFIDEGVNGFVAASLSPEDLASAILLVRAGGSELRESTARWFAENAPSLSLEDSLTMVLAAYAPQAWASPARS
jgi:glycosyltransferase involved in cell wall biosynthesis